MQMRRRYVDPESLLIVQPKVCCMNRPNHRSKLRRVTVLRSLGSLAIAGPLVAFALRAAARAGDAIEPGV